MASNNKIFLPLKESSAHLSHSWTQADWAATILHFLVVQSLRRGQLFVTLGTAACQVSLSFTISWMFSQILVHSVGDALQPKHILHIAGDKRELWRGPANPANSGSDTWGVHSLHWLEPGTRSHLEGLREERTGNIWQTTLMMTSIVLKMCWKRSFDKSRDDLSRNGNNVNSDGSQCWLLQNCSHCSSLKLFSN